jgi:3-phenylpropionate/cinnamic acid dioxygenase small subunit
MDTVMAADDLRAAEAFLTHEAHLLDSARYEEWLSLFTEDATYWVPAAADQPDPHSAISLMYDDRRLLETRVRRLAAAAAHATTPRGIATRQVTNLALVGRDAAGLTVRSKFTMVEYRRNAQRLFAGSYVHRLVRAESAFKIAAKRVNLVNCEAELEGLVLPF